MKDIKWIYIFLVLFFSARAQVDSNFIKHASPKTLKQMGKSALKQNDPSSAIVFYEAYLKNNDKDAEAMNNLANAYLQTRDYRRAQILFLNAYNMDKTKAPEALYYHAKMQKSNSLYDSAKINFQRFRKEYKGDNKELKKQATREISFCDSLQGIIKKDNKIIIQRLDTTINKVNAEGAPFNTDENTLIFTSLRTDKREYVYENEDSAKTRKKKLYKAVRKGDKWSFAGEYGSNLNDEEMNTANACFSPDRKRIYFTRCNPNSKGEMICAIYVSEKMDDEWSEPEKLPSQINNPKYTSSMPAVTNDAAKGNNEIIYFVSNNKEGKGGMDIWYTVYNKKTKEYKEPKNAGAKVNTSQNEITPFFDNETRTLYFSSDGQGGMGGFDIFKALGDGKSFSGIENAGLPFNSGADDVYFTISPNREEGFFVSNREGGNALKNSTCCDDIYYYKQTEYIKIKLKGKIRDESNNAVIPDAIVEIYVKDKFTQEKIWIKNITADASGNYEINLEAGRDYAMIARQKEFLSNNIELSTGNITRSIDIERDLQLQKKPKDAIFIPNIQYEFNKSQMTNESKTVLDTTILKLMKNNPELIIEISSHTDSKGSNEFNRQLSQQRAESVVAYLISKGIAPVQLKAKGYGETMPLAPNENPDGSDNPEGRAKNRRTDFKIIGELDAEIIRIGN